MPVAGARGFWITAPGKGAIRPTTLMRATQGCVGIRTLYSAVSAGTERLVYQGLVPENQYQLMRAPFQEGSFPGPVLYGYNNVGIVEEGPSELVGTCAFTLCPHVDRFTVPAQATIPIPAEIPPERAILTANMETALNSIWDAEVRFGERVAIIGAGVLGCLIAFLAGKIAHASVILIDRNPERSAVAVALGIDFALPEAVEGEFDVVFHATGNESGLNHALRIAHFEGRIIELSWYGSRPVDVSLGENFHSRRLTIKSSQVGSVSPAMRNRLTHYDRQIAALSLLDDDRLDKLIDHETSFEHLPETFADLAAGTINPLCIRVRYH